MPRGRITMDGMESLLNAFGQRSGALGWTVLLPVVMLVCMVYWDVRPWTWTVVLAAGAIALLAPVEAPGTRLTYREREVLALMAEGRSNSAIAQRLFVSEKAVTKHSTSIFAKLGLPPSEDDNRRVLAVLAYLNA